MCVVGGVGLVFGEEEECSFVRRISFQQVHLTRTKAREFWNIVTAVKPELHGDLQKWNLLSTSTVKTDTEAYCLHEYRFVGRPGPAFQCSLVNHVEPLFVAASFLWRTSSRGGRRA